MKKILLATFALFICSPAWAEDPDDPKNRTLIFDGVYTPGYGQFARHGGGGNAWGAKLGWQIVRFFETSLTLGYGSVGLGGKHFSYHGPVLEWHVLPHWNIHGSLSFLYGRGYIRDDQIVSEETEDRYFAIDANDIDLNLIVGLTPSLQAVVSVGMTAMNSVDDRGATFADNEDQSGFSYAIGIRGSQL